MSKKLTPISNLSLAMVLVGSSVVAGKIMVAELPIFLASALRFVLALMILIPIVFMREGGLPRISRRSWLMMAGQSLCGSFLFTVFLLYGLTLTGPASAGIITSTTPACMGIIAWLFLKDRPSTRTGLGIALSVLGVLVINLVQGNGVTGTNPLAGNLLVLCAVIFESLFLLIRKDRTRATVAPGRIHHHLPVRTALVPAHGRSRGVLHRFCSHLRNRLAGGFLLRRVRHGPGLPLLVRGHHQVSPSTAGVFTAIMPVSALVLSALILDEPIGWQQLTGCGCVLGGIVLISK